MEKTKLQKDLKEYRELRGVSQAELATRLTTNFGYNVSRDAVKSWESGRNTPKIQSMAKLRTLFSKAGIE